MRSPALARDLETVRCVAGAPRRSATYFNEVDRGGHFPAWEQPDLFVTEMRAAFQPLRKS